MKTKGTVSHLQPSTYSSGDIVIKASAPDQTGSNDQMQDLSIHCPWHAFIEELKRQSHDHRKCAKDVFVFLWCFYILIVISILYVLFVYEKLFYKRVLCVHLFTYAVRVIAIL